MMKLRYGTIPAVLAAAGVLSAQEKPLTISGTFSTGYYDATTRGEASQSAHFIPVGARFDVNGYLLSPDLFSFSAQPETNAGPQASEAGFQGGNGIQLRTTFLRQSVSPLTFRYSNLQVKDIYFGGLSQVSGYSLKNRTKDIGATWELRPKHLPEFIVDWGTGSVNSKSGVEAIPDYNSRGHHINAEAKYEIGEWTIDGVMRRGRQDSDLLTPIDGGTQTGSLRERAVQYQGSVRRGFLRDSEVYVDAGSQSTSNLLFALPVDLATRYANANLRFGQQRRWKTSLRAAYSSNLASQLLERAAGTLGVPGAVAPDGDILAPFSRGISSLNVNAATTLAVGRGLDLFGSVERSAILSSSEDRSLDSRYFSASTGATYTRHFSWGGFSGEYARDYGVGSLTGQSGTIHGQRYLAGVQLGRAGGLQFDTSLRGSGQDVRTAQPLSNSSLSAEGSVSDRIFGSLGVRVGGGWQWSNIVNRANEFRSDGYTARAGIEHPRFQAAATLNDTLSNSLPFYNDLIGGLGPGGGGIPVELVPSAYRSIGFTLHTNPVRKLELSGSWTRSRQRMDGILGNDFEFLNAFVTYHYRRVLLEAGLIRFNQAFLSYPAIRRTRFYVRVVRTARIL